MEEKVLYDTGRINYIFERKFYALASFFLG
jgi:hypothetical protein